MPVLTKEMKYPGRDYMITVVLMRYVVKDVSMKEYDEFYSHSPFYVIVRAIKNKMGKQVGYKLIYDVPLTEEWLRDYETENQGFKCRICKDTGINRAENRYCKCELGQLAKKHFCTNHQVKEEVKVLEGQLQM